MKLKTRVEGGSNFQKELVPADVHSARLFRIVDLGSQRKEWQGDVKYKREVEFTWELPDEMRTYNPENGEQPMYISQTFSAVLGDKSNLGKALAAWGADLSDDDFDLKDLFDLPCQLTVEHAIAKSSKKEFAKIVNISKVPKRALDSFPAPIKERVVFSLEEGEFDADVFSSLPTFMQDKIAVTEEYQKVTGTAVEPVEEGDLPIA